jgi:hypothetical protein
MRRFLCALVLVCAATSLAEAQQQVYLSDVIKQPPYLAALTALLNKSGNLPAWIKRVLNPKGDYVGDTAHDATVDGTKYELFFSCQAHDCGNNQLEVMFAPGGARAWGAIIVNAKPIAYLGDPSPGQQAALKAALNK